MGKYKIVNLHSAEQNTSGDGPKLPTKEQIEYGEIAVNYLKDNEKLAIRNNNDEIITFATEKSLSGYAGLNDDNTFSGTNSFNGKIKLFDSEGVLSLSNDNYLNLELGEGIKIDNDVIMKDNDTSISLLPVAGDIELKKGDNKLSLYPTGIASSNGDSNTVWNTNGGTNYIGDYCKFMTPNNLLANLGSLTYWKNVKLWDYRPYGHTYQPINDDEWCYAPVIGSYMGGTFTLSFGVNKAGEATETSDITIEVYGDKRGEWTTDAEAYLNTGALKQAFSLSTDSATEYTTKTVIQKNVLYKVSNSKSLGGRYFVRFDEPYSDTYNLVFRWKGKAYNGRLERPILFNGDMWCETVDDSLVTLDFMINERIKALEDKIAELERKLNS